MVNVLKKLLLKAVAASRLRPQRIFKLLHSYKLHEYEMVNWLKNIVLKKQ